MQTTLLALLALVLVAATLCGVAIGMAILQGLTAIGLALAPVVGVLGGVAGLLVVEIA
jgi:hypothetical protein